jgi:hypothetical protein
LPFNTYPLIDRFLGAIAREQTDRFRPTRLLPTVCTNDRSWQVYDDEGRQSKAGRLCPSNSDGDLFSYGEGIVDLDAEISDSALYSPDREQWDKTLAGMYEL